MEKVWTWAQNNWKEPWRYLYLRKEFLFDKLSAKIKAQLI